MGQWCSARGKSTNKRQTKQRTYAQESVKPRDGVATKLMPEVSIVIIRLGESRPTGHKLDIDFQKGKCSKLKERVTAPYPFISVLETAVLNTMDGGLTWTYCLRKKQRKFIERHSTY